MHRDHRSGEGACVRATWVKVGPDQIDRGIDFYKMTILPAITVDAASLVRTHCAHIRLTSTHCIKCRSPIGGDGLLRRSEWHSAFADKLMQPRFDAIFRVWGCTGFDPQVAGIVRVPAKFKWHEMVILSVCFET